MPSLIIISHPLFYINLCFRIYLKSGETVLLNFIIIIFIKNFIYIFKLF